MRLGDQKNMLGSCRIDVMESHEALVLGASKHVKQGSNTDVKANEHSRDTPS